MCPSNVNIDDSNNKRGRFRFTLRWVFVVVALLSIWLGIRVNRAAKLRRALDEFSVGFGYKGEQFQPPRWAEDLIGREYFLKVDRWDVDITAYGMKHGGPNEEALAVLEGIPLKFLEVSGDERVATVTDTAIHHIAQIDTLESLHIWHCQLTTDALEKLTKLKRLEALWLNSKHLTDEHLRPIASLKNLDDLTLNDTQITDDGLRIVRQLPRLKKLNLERTPITDDGLDVLRELKNLEWIDLLGCESLSRDGISKLEAALPQCTIRHNFE